MFPILCLDGAGGASAVGGCGPGDGRTGRRWAAAVLWLSPQDGDAERPPHGGLTICSTTEGAEHEDGEGDLPGVF
ncbi:hypothetical protein GDO78_010512 [Eleutherodactylus coqui]|uniref:Uncharacterized protein n=1 Tax=Eleutherodactylus coqui TaxID=57060 RepID=A0A8J6K7B5_ELECQ|nr:hypothetical protein GDO78_010512 [Eleutherodactylus coqui]